MSADRRTGRQGDQVPGLPAEGSAEGSAAADRAGDGPAPEVDRPDPSDRVLDGRPVAEQLGLTPPSEVARAALHRAKAAARARGFRPGQAVPRRGPSPDLRSGSGRDARDPAPVGDTLSRLVGERGWEAELSVGGVIGRWAEVVGEQVAEHCMPETFEEGVLVVRADSTAWATNLTLLVPQLLAKLEQEVGRDVVRRVTVLGPTGPRWVRGPRTVPGRGPRDTYG